MSARPSASRMGRSAASAGPPSDAAGRNRAPARNRSSVSLAGGIGGWSDYLDCSDYSDYLDCSDYSDYLDCSDYKEAPRDTNNDPLRSR